MAASKKTSANDTSPTDERCLTESAALAGLTKELCTVQSIENTFSAILKHLSMAFPTYVSVNLVEESGRYLVVRAHKIASKLIHFVEKLMGKKYRNWKIPLTQDTVIAQTIKTGHPTVIGLDFTPDEPVIQTDMQTMLEALVQEGSPLRKLTKIITERVKSQSLLGIPFKDSKGQIIGSITVLSPQKFSLEDFNLVKVAADVVGQSIEQATLSKALKESEERYRSLIANMNNGFIIYNEQGILTYVNNRFCEMLDYAPEELLSKPISNFLDDKNRTIIYAQLVKQKEGREKHFELTWISKDNSRVNSIISPSVRRDAKGNYLETSAIVTNISILKAMEFKRIVMADLLADLREAKTLEECLQLGCDAVKNARLFKRAVFTLKDNEGKTTHWAQVGLDPEVVAKMAASSPATPEIMKQMLREEFKISNSYFIPADAGVNIKQTGRYLIQEEPSNTEEQGWKKGDELLVSLLSKSGAPESYLSVDTPFNMKRPDIETILYLEDIVDIIGRQIREIRYLKTLKTSEARFRRFTEVAQVGIYIFSKDDRFIYVNPEMEKITGYSSDELLAINPLDLILKDDLEGVLEERKLARKKGLDIPDHYMIRVRRKNGELAYMEIKTSPIVYMGEEVQLGHCIDVTDRALVEKKNKHLNAVLKAVRNVNQLITKERNRDILLKQACEKLVESRGYFSAWVVCVDSAKKTTSVTESGLNEVCPSLLNKLRENSIPECMTKILDEDIVTLVDMELEDCLRPCIHHESKQMGLIAKKLAYGEKIYGVIAVLLPQELSSDKEEQDLFIELANDLAFALYSIETEKGRKAAEAEREKTSRALEKEHHAFQIIADAALGATGIPDLCQKVLSGLITTLNFHFASLRLYKEESNALELIASVGFTDDERKKASKPRYLDDSQYIAVHTANTGQAIIAPDVYDEKELIPFRNRLEKLHIRSIISWPIMGVSRNLLGVMHLWNHEPTEITKHDRKLFERITGMFAAALERKLAEIALFEEKERIQKYLDIAGVMLIVVDRDEKVTLINKKGCKILGYDEIDILGKNWFNSFIPQQFKSFARKRFNLLMHSQKEPAESQEYPVINSKGEERIIIWYHTVLTDELGNISGVLSSGEDITERKRTELERDRHRLELESLFEGVDVLLWSLREENGELYYERVNSAFAAVEAHLPEFYNGNPISKLHSPEECKEIWDTFDKIKTGEPYSTEVYRNSRHFIMRFIPLPEPDSKVKRLIATGVDITERKRFEEMLKAREETIKSRLFYEETIAYCSRVLVETANLQEAFEKVITELIAVAGVSRVFIFENFEDPEKGLSARQVAGADSGKEYRREKNASIHISYTDLPQEMVAKMDEGRPYGNPVFELSFIQTVDIKARQKLSTLVYPIKLENHPWGFIGFEDSSKDRPWKHEDIQLLQTVGSIIGSTIDRKRSERELRRHSRTIEGLYNSSKRINRSLSMDELLDNSADLLADTPGVFAGAIYLINKNSSALELTKTFGSKLEDFQEIADFSLKNELVQDVFAEQGALIKNNYKSIQSELATDIYPTSVHLISVAMRSGHEILGMLTLAIAWVDEHTLNFAETVAGELAAVVKRIQAEDALRDSEERYRVLTEEAMVGIYLALGSKFLFVNPAMERILGYSREELLGMDIFDMLPVESVKIITERKKKRKPNQPDQYTMNIVRKNGEKAILEVRTRPISYGNQTAFLGNCVDVTELFKQRSQIERAKKEWESTFDSISDLVMILDPEYRILRANRAVAEYIGVDVKEVQGRSFYEIFNVLEEKDSTAITLKLSEYFELADTFRNRTFSVSSSSLHDPSGNQVASVHVARDITEMRNIEAALSESEAQFRGLAESAQDIIFSLNLEGKIIYINPAVEDIMGLSQLSLTGELLQDVVESVSSKPSVNVAEIISEISSPDTSGKRSLFEAEIKDTKGKKHVLEISVRRLPNKIVGIARDVTERKRMQQQLINASKLASLGVLAAGIAHQVNNPLAIMLATSSLLRTILAENLDVPTAIRKEVSKYLDTMEEQVDRTNKVVTGLLKFTKPKRSETKPSSVNEIVSEALSLLSKHLNRDKVMVETKFQNNLPLALVDPVALQQVIINVVQNAFEAMIDMGSQGKIVIATELAEPEMIRIVIHDNGPGIPPALRDEIFEPLVSSKTDKQGTGLGLSIAVMLLERFKGRIYLEDTSIGASFVIEVPGQPQ